MLIKNPAVQQPKSSLSHKALAGLIVGLATAALSCAAITVLVTRKKKARRKLNQNKTIVDSAQIPELMCPHQIVEMPGENEPREIMNERLDRAELIACHDRPPIELPG